MISHGCCKRGFMGWITLKHIPADLINDMVRTTIMRCERCGSVLPVGSLFCENCGARLRVQTQSRNAAGTGGGKGKSANKKRGRRARRARRIRNALYIGGAAVAIAILFLGINFFSKAKTTRAISSADVLVSTALAGYTDPTGAVSIENSETALSAVYQSALEAVSRGTFKSAEQGDNYVAIGLPGGGYYVYLASDGETDGAVSSPGESALDHSTQILENTKGRQFGSASSLWNRSAASSDDKLKIVTVQPSCKETKSTHPSEWSYPDLAAETIVANLDTYSFADNGSVRDDNRDDTEVSISFLKTLSEYAVVIWHGHGGYLEETGSYLCITENFSSRYFYDLIKNRVVMLYGGGMGVTSTFFDKYLKKNTNDNSLIYLGTCLSGKDSTLANAFLDKGFDCVVVNSNSINRTYNLDTMKAFFDGMAAGPGEFLTAKEALVNAKLTYGDYDPFSYPGDRAVPLLYGDATVRFAKEQTQVSAEPAATAAPTTVPAGDWAQVFTDVLGMEKVGTVEDSFTPMVFMLLDMNGDGIPELIAAELVDGEKAEELVFTPNEIGAVISQYAIYTYQNGEAVCLFSQWNSYANCIFKVYNDRNIVSGDSGSGFEGFIVLNYDGNKLTASELATDWAHAELEGLEEPYYLYGKYTNLQDIGSEALEYISKAEYDAKYNEIFSDVTLPVFYNNTVDMRNRIFGVSLPAEQPSATETFGETANATEQICRMMVDQYAKYLGRSYADICAARGNAKTCYFVGEGDSAFTYAIDGRQVDFYFDHSINWDDLFTPEELYETNFSCSGSYASSFYPADATCQRVMIVGGQTTLLDCAITPDSAITGSAEKYYPEGADEFYYRLDFVYQGYRIIMDLNNERNIDANCWISIQLNYDY